MDSREYRETLAKQEDLNWDGNPEQEQIEYTYIVDEDSIEKLKNLLND